MDDKSKWGLIGLALSLIICSIIIANALKQMRSSSETITVTGSARKPVTSDLIVWRGQITSFASNLPDAYRALSDHREKVRRFFKTFNLSDTSYTFSQPSNWAERSYDERGREGKIIGYSYNQNFTVQSTDMDKIEKLIQASDQLILEGIPLDFRSPEYLVLKLAEYRLSLLSEATKDAQNRAEKIASGVNNKIGSIRSARVGVFQVNAPNSMEVSDYGVYDTSTRQKEITAVVSVSFAIR